MTMTNRWRSILLTAALALSLTTTAAAQTALNQVRLATAVTSDSQTAISLTVADSVTVGDLLYVDMEAMIVSAVNTTTDVVTASRGQFGTASVAHLTGSVVWTGRNNYFYFFNPPLGRCTASTAYPGGYQPWINVLTGSLSYCEDDAFGETAATAGYWHTTANKQDGGGTVAYTPIAYRTSRTSDATVVTPAYTVKLSDVLIASLTYSGPFEVFLPAATGLLGKQLIISDVAGLATGSPGGRTITIRGVVDGANNPTISTANGLVRYFVGISATSQYGWFSW